jgi:hypothetical protein
MTYFVHFQYGKTTFQLKEEFDGNSFCERLSAYIKEMNLAPNSFDKITELLNKVKDCIVWKDEDEKVIFDMVISHISIMPPSQEELLFSSSEYREGIALFIQSVESLKTGSRVFSLSSRSRKEYYNLEEKRQLISKRSFASLFTIS